MDQPRIVFMGAGAIGSYLGAYMTKGGYGPTLIDPWPEHVETMRSKGLRASGSQGDFTVMVDAMHLTEVQNVRRPFDIAFIAMKSYDTEWATHFIKRYLAPAGFIVCAQNSINDETIASIAGYDRVIGLIMSSISVHLVAPGHVVRGTAPGRDRGYDVFRAGEFSGVITPRAKQVAELLDCVDASRVTPNLWGERWSKLATNCMGNTLTAMSGLSAGSLAKIAPRFPLLRDQVVRELVEVGLALGVAMEPIGGKPAEQWLDLPNLNALPTAGAAGSVDSLDPNRPSEFAPSTLQDILKGRKTEIDFLNGYVSRRGREAGIATPVNDAIVRVLKDVESGLLSPQPSNVDRVWDLVQPIPAVAST
ncbi:MAG TPA: 2-dehydropantoate 2-reductase [Dehalococcoidia bacterium]|nr:2-dehydropantoate 2-reductase [Dehalococcoidia bacterium]